MNFAHVRRISLMGLIALCCLAGSAFADEAPVERAQEHEVAIGAGGGVSVSPYRGYSTQWRAFPILSYEGEYAYLRGFKAGIKLVNLDFLELSAYGGYDPTEFSSKDSTDRHMRRLSNRYSSAVVGGEARLLTPYGMLHASLDGDVLGHSNGLKGSAGYMQSVEFGPLELIPSAGIHWSDSKYNDYYYGVDDRQARKSGFREYTPGSGIAPYLGLTLDYSITEQWEVFCSGEITFLEKGVKDSPMVDRSNSYGFSAGVSYDF